VGFAFLMVIKMEALTPAHKIKIPDAVLRETLRLIVDSVRRTLDPLSLPKVEIAEYDAFPKTDKASSGRASCPHARSVSFVVHLPVWTSSI
jgi:hypothetical protein